MASCLPVNDVHLRRPAVYMWRLMITCLCVGRRECSFLAMELGGTTPTRSGRVEDGVVNCHCCCERDTFTRLHFNDRNFSVVCFVCHSTV